MRAELVVFLTVCALAAAPALWWALSRRPLLVYAAYVFAVPFDSILGVGAGGTAARVLGAAAGITLLFWTLSRRAFVRPPAAAWLWFALAVWMGVTLLWSPDVPAGLRQWSTLLQVLGLYFAACIAPLEARDCKLLLGAIAASGVVAAAYALYHFAHPDPALVQLVAVEGRLQLQAGTEGLDINVFADALLLPISIGVTAALAARHWIPKLVWLATVALMVAAVYAAASREALICIVALLLYVAVVSSRRVQLVPVFALLGGAAFFIPNMTQRFLSAFQTGGSGRLSIWSVGYHAFKAHWAAGAGAGGFGYAYNENYLSVFQPYIAGWERSASNVPLQTAVELGVFGLLLLVLAWGAQFFVLRDIGRNDPLYEARVALTGGLVAITVAALFTDIVTAKFVWLAAAAVVQLRNTRLVSRDALERGARQAQAFRPMRGGQVVLPLRRPT